jgi:uncharacterized protein YecT (DUF1311 family)
MRGQIACMAVAIAMLGNSAFGADVQSLEDLPGSRGWERFCAPFSAPTLAEAAQARSPIVQRLCKQPPDQWTLNQCAGYARVSAEAHLGSTYTRVRKSLPDQASRNRFAAVHRAWCNFRDAACTFDVPPNAQGSMMPMLLAGCLEGYAANRSASLAAFAHCLENDSCPRPVTLFMLDLHPEVRPTRRVPAPR